jgi:hypothetical protein
MHQRFLIALDQSARPIGSTPPAVLDAEATLSGREAI